jgi:tyrosinase
VHNALNLHSKFWDSRWIIVADLYLEVHGVAQFLPWHRYFIHVYETALKTKCGYTGVAM